MSDISDIKSLFMELEQLKNEISTTNKKLKILRSRSRTIEDQMIEIIKSRNLTGFKYKGKVVELNEKTVHKRKKNTDKDEDIKSFLSTLGIHNVSEVYNDLKQIQKGKQHVKSSLKF